MNTPSNLKAISSSNRPQQKPESSPPTRLLLIRHGEVEPRHQHTFGGRIDMNLSARGQEQAKTLAEYLRGKTIDAIYASPMKRVQQTLAPFLNNGASTPAVLRPSSAAALLRRVERTGRRKPFCPRCANWISAIGPGWAGRRSANGSVSAL